MINSNWTFRYPLSEADRVTNSPALCGTVAFQARYAIFVGLLKEQDAGVHSALRGLNLPGTEY